MDIKEEAKDEPAGEGHGKGGKKGAKKRELPSLQVQMPTLGKFGLSEREVDLVVRMKAFSGAQGPPVRLFKVSDRTVMSHESSQS